MLVIRTWRKQLTSAFEKGRLSGRQSRPREATVASRWDGFCRVGALEVHSKYLEYTSFLAISCTYQKFVVPFPSYLPPNPYPDPTQP